MSWIPCSGNSSSKAKIKKKKKTQLQENPVDQIKVTSDLLPSSQLLVQFLSSYGDETKSSLSAKEASNNGGPDHIAAQTFPFRELAAATRNFRPECLLGEGGFGRVYKGRLESTNQARPLFKDRSKFSQMADPVLQGQYPPRGLYQALAVAAMCVQEQPNMRPVIADVVTALNYLASQKCDPDTQPVQNSRFAPGTPRAKRDSEKKAQRW
ncbi:hypothetical protein FEM48_Zijuj12G0154800 [Ziziphus jujuba var. spinosa]|uniref:Uncharacterized protein n=1 Tax=Ziziphus jujuba var. spinosa TaxID=714518 RepID=A0A978UE53_ZIZJJ|nr:hypothetical protein FEM48_Zijuj12G0154800 [Ziziphus jujuba var. spinosa]